MSMTLLIKSLPTTLYFVVSSLIDGSLSPQAVSDKVIATRASENKNFFMILLLFS
jgi:hypothetical protein